MMSRTSCLTNEACTEFEHCYTLMKWQSIAIVLLLAGHVAWFMYVNVKFEVTPKDVLTEVRALQVSVRAQTERINERIDIIQDVQTTIKAKIGIVDDGFKHQRSLQRELASLKAEISEAQSPEE